MTQEEKAQAYDEALEKAKIEINTKGIGEAVDLCEQLFPQLTESEDERTRKWILEYLYDGLRKSDEQFKEQFKDAIAWLEKQKEQKHNYCLYGGYPNVGRCRWCYAACSARLADVHTDEEKEYIRTIKSIISDFIRDKKPENLAYYQRIYDWLDGRHVPFSCGHENGQPVDPVFSKQEYESHPIISTDTTSVKPVELDGKALLHTADKSYQIGFRDGVASVKPAEWSESDKDVLMDAICATDKLGNNEVYNKNNPNLAKAFRVAKDWLKNLPERFNLPQTQEWSEEDEHRRDGIIQWLREYQAKFNLKYDSLSIESIESLINWLKSIRPSWKPNEEQMEALDKARRFIPYNCDVLESLYVDLKKL